MAAVLLPPLRVGRGFWDLTIIAARLMAALLRSLRYLKKKNVILLEKIRRGLHLLHSYRQRKDLNKAAIKRAAIIVRSQNPLPTWKGGNKTAAKESDIHFLIRFLGCGLVTSFAGWKGFLGPDDNSSAFDGSLVKILAVPEKNSKMYLLKW